MPRGAAGVDGGGPSVAAAALQQAPAVPPQGRQGAPPPSGPGAPPHHRGWRHRGLCAAVGAGGAGAGTRHDHVVDDGGGTPLRREPQAVPKRLYQSAPVGASLSSSAGPRPRPHDRVVGASHAGGGLRRESYNNLKDFLRSAGMRSSPAPCPAVTHAARPPAPSLPRYLHPPQPLIGGHVQPLPPHGHVGHLPRAARRRE